MSKMTDEEFNKFLGLDDPPKEKAIKIKKVLNLKKCTDNYKEAKEEVSNERDLEFSNLHRKFGYYCPAVDIDFLLIEYISGVPVALIEYKHSGASYDINHVSFDAIRSLANASKIPAYIVEYSDNHLYYRVIALNEIGKEKILELDLSDTMDKKDGDLISCQDYVTFLYKLKGYEVPPQILEKIEKYFEDKITDITATTAT